MARNNLPRPEITKILDRIYDPRISPQELVELYDMYSDNATIVEHIASNEKTPVSLLEKFVKGDPNVRWALAQNKKIPTGLLETLAKDDVDVIRISVARNPQATEDILSFMAGGERQSSNPHSEIILREILENKNCPEWLHTAVLFLG